VWVGSWVEALGIGNFPTEGGRFGADPLTPDSLRSSRLSRPQGERGLRADVERIWRGVQLVQVWNAREQEDRLKPAAQFAGVWFPHLKVGANHGEAC